MKHTRESIVNRFNAGEPMQILAFWDERPVPGKVTEACFSQWYDCRFEADGITYHTAEQYMMAQKALLMGDREVCAKIMAVDNPEEYKALGRQVQNFDPDLWERQKYSIVVQGNLAKFSQNAELRAFLESTGDSVIVEGSPDDEIWGVGLYTEDPYIRDPNKWQGENLLGFALMEVREILRQERES